MLEKLLPSIFKKKNELDQNPSQQPENQKKISNEEESLESGFNLISETQNLYVVPKFSSELILLIRKFIVWLSIIFGVLLILNLMLSFVIDYQKNWQNKLVSEIDTYAGVEEKARLINDKTLSYKKFLDGRQKISDKTNYVLDNVGSEVELKNLRLNNSGFDISFSGKNALDFTNLIVRYLGGGMVSEIVINSANLDKSKDLFNVTIRGNFK